MMVAIECDLPQNNNKATVLYFKTVDFVKFYQFKKINIFATKVVFVISSVFRHKIFWSLIINYF